MLWSSWHDRCSARARRTVWVGGQITLAALVPAAPPRRADTAHGRAAVQPDRLAGVRRTIDHHRHLEHCRRAAPRSTAATRRRWWSSSSWWPSPGRPRAAPHTGAQAGVDRRVRRAHRPVRRCRRCSSAFLLAGDTGGQQHGAAHPGRPAREPRMTAPRSADGRRSAGHRVSQPWQPAGYRCQAGWFRRRGGRAPRCRPPGSGPLRPGRSRRRAG